MTRAILPIAWRNLTRNLRRSLITLSAIAIGMTALLFLWGFNDGSHNNMMRNIAASFVGGVQIHKEGFFLHPKMEDAIPDPEAIRAALAHHPDIPWTQRLMSFALIAGADTSAGAMLLGLDPQREQQTTTLATKVDQGRFFQNSDERSCIMGATQARNLQVALGDEVVVLTQDYYGGMAADRFTLVGIIGSGEMGIDRGLVLLPLRQAQTLLGMEGRVTEFVLQPSMEQVERLAAALKVALKGQEVEVLRWFDMYPMMKEWVAMDNGFFYIFMTIVLFLVVSGLLSTVLVSMLERTHEFGILMALGTTRIEIAAIVLIESLFIVVGGILLGVGAGLGLVAHYHKAGIDLGNAMDTATRFYIDTVIRTEIDTDHLWITIVAMGLSTLLAALWPAWKATRLEPVEAIHHV
ncbi:MAG: ABC transporter permease [Alphaproteobacteria bacterium CG_4_10_14_0_2_um_filter_63_37]|nr:MAG: hypothetical protein AUJ55_11760 [Proteobacteria bacterium CG1_02_64_396]PJA23650.1 MAG: ABC transporter permease [Alphaproteobacteria bacterium CG_4_10_14_0_2_um_filter_63_37]